MRVFDAGPQGPAGERFVVDAVRRAYGLIEAEAIGPEQKIRRRQLAGGLARLARQGDVGAIALLAVAQPEFFTVAAQCPREHGQLVRPLTGPHPGGFGALKPAGLIQMDAERGAVLSLGGRDQASLGRFVGLPEKGQGQVQVALGHRLAGPGALVSPGRKLGGKLWQGQGKEEFGHAACRSS